MNSFHVLLIAAPKTPFGAPSKVGLSSRLSIGEWSHTLPFGEPRCAALLYSVLAKASQKWNGAFGGYSFWCHGNEDMLPITRDSSANAAFGGFAAASWFLSQMNPLAVAPAPLC